MNKFIKLFTPSDEKLSKMSFNDLQQLPVAILGNFIFLFGFSMTFVAEMLRGTYLTAAGSGIAVLIFLTSFLQSAKDSLESFLVLQV